jgi:Fe-S-cluster formation regulator IscX/YfhJ
LIEPAAGLVAAEVVALRTKFRTVLDIHRSFAGNLSWSGNVYRAAVTAGLVGDFALARQLFTRIAELDPSKHGLNLKDIQNECAALASFLEDPQAYRSAILEKIEARRRERGFPPDPLCLESLQMPRIE